MNRGQRRRKGARRLRDPFQSGRRSHKKAQIQTLRERELEEERRFFLQLSQGDAT